VVFGALDPKTGAAGSVVNLFEQVALNHQTTLQGGVLANKCATQLQSFFKTKREQNRLEAKMNHPLRSDALRTADSAFDKLPGYPWPANYVSDLPSLSGLRLHYLDEGRQDTQTDSTQTTYLCLHGNPAWSYLYRKMLPIFLEAESRVVAPDLIGFGKSDKPKRDSVHTFEFHRNSLLELVEALDLHNVVLVVQDWGGILGLTLPMQAPQRYRALVAMNTLLATGTEPLSKGFLDWREMCRKKPNFDVGRLLGRAALRAFPNRVPDSPDAPGAAISRLAEEFWRSSWQGQAVMAVGALDPVLGPQVMARLRSQIRGCPEPIILPSSGHFVQEQGEALAAQVLECLRTP
jgi:tRNA(adenine34) deaminase